MHRHPGRVRRGRRRRAARGRGRRGDGAARNLELRPRRAQHPRALRAELRLRAAEAALAAAHGHRRAGGCDRDDRAGRGLRPAGDQGAGRARRRPLRAERLEDVHLERPARGTRRRRREDGPDEGLEGHLDHHARDAGPARLPGRARARQDRPERLGHGGVLPRRLPRACRLPARPRGRAGIRAADARPALRARAARTGRRGRDGVRARAHHRVHASIARRSARRCSRCRTRASRSRT